MAERAHLDWFRERLAASRAIEPKDPAPILAWREQQRDRIRFKADLIGLDDVRGWSRDEQRQCAAQERAVLWRRGRAGRKRRPARGRLMGPADLHPAGGRDPGAADARDARRTASNSCCSQGRAGKYRRAPAFARPFKARGRTSGAPTPASARRWWKCSPPKPASGSSTGPNTMRRAAGSGASRTRTSSRFWTTSA